MNFIKQELNEISKYKNIDINAYITNSITRKVIERTIEMIMNAIIDISKLILVGEDTQIPTSYRDSIQQLQLIGMIDESTTEKLIKYVDLRNILAHEYLDIRWAKIKSFLDEGFSTIEKFFEIINERIFQEGGDKKWRK